MCCLRAAPPMLRTAHLCSPLPARPQPTSLCDLGYCDVGLDDHWQKCGAPDAAKGMHYHDDKGHAVPPDGSPGPQANRARQMPRSPLAV